MHSFQSVARVQKIAVVLDECCIGSQQRDEKFTEVKRGDFSLKSFILSPLQNMQSRRFEHMVHLTKITQH